MRNSDLFEEMELVNSGHVGCPGCGATIAMKLALRALGDKTMVVIPACCWAIIAGNYPQSALKVPVLNTAFATTGAVCSGLRAALDLRGEIDTTIIGWAGDGGTFDIGFQALSAAAERGDDFIYICYDNEAYMNTGVQRSSSTPWGASTMTTPGAGWKRTQKKNIVEIMAAHRIPYAATANIAYPEDLERKLRKARSIRTGLRFIHLFASCPTGWGFAPADAIKISRMAVLTRAFPLYEVEEGESYTINSSGDVPVRDYLKMQNRFRRLSDGDIAMIQEHVDREWERLNRKARG
ncbi:MAG TPA: thiamine pyrophosphate-dependent enzyme [bacterium]|nr:thiamine pyrophosphate-dependent enzyme [bacterium]